MLLGTGTALTADIDKQMDIQVAGCAVYFDCTLSKAGKMVCLVVDKNVGEGTEMSYIQVYSDGVLAQNVTRTLTYTPGTTAPKTAPDEGAEIPELAEALKSAK